MNCVRGSFELQTDGLGIWLNKGISLTLRHGWQYQVIEKHVRNAQVVPILYSSVTCEPPFSTGTSYPPHAEFCLTRVPRELLSLVRPSVVKMPLVLLAGAAPLASRLA